MINVEPVGERVGPDRATRIVNMSCFVRSLESAVVLFALAIAGTGCVASKATPVVELRGGENYLFGHAATTGDGLVNVVIEIPAGTNDKWEVSKTGQSIEWKTKEGKLRVVQYLAYPANYGMIPRTLLPVESGGDGDPLDAVVLGPTLERGVVVLVRPIGVLRLIDDGERDDKIVAVRTTGPLSDVSSLRELDANYPGVTLLIETWFANYKGSGRTESRGIEGSDVAVAVVREASAYFERATQ